MKISRSDVKRTIPKRRPQIRLMDSVKRASNAKGISVENRRVSAYDRNERRAVIDAQM